ncbi:hypothetical protein OAV10_00865 [Hyphomicrobiales bacterium]|nr:hypothetical protein [Hyphomicrobiales bacterium]
MNKSFFIYLLAVIFLFPINLLSQELGNTFPCNSPALNSNLTPSVIPLLGLSVTNIPYQFNKKLKSCSENDKYSRSYSSRNSGFDEFGVVIHKVEKNSRALEANLMCGYIITHLNNKRIKNSEDFKNKIYQSLKNGYLTKIDYFGSWSVNRMNNGGRCPSEFEGSETKIRNLERFEIKALNDQEEKLRKDQKRAKELLLEKERLIKEKLKKEKIEQEKINKEKRNQKKLETELELIKEKRLLEEIRANEKRLLKESLAEEKRLFEIEEEKRRIEKKQRLKSAEIFDNCIIEEMPSEPVASVEQAIIRKCERISNKPTKIEDLKYKD